MSLKVSVSALRAAATKYASARTISSSAPALAKILCSDNIDPICVDLFKERGHDVTYKTGMDEAELCNFIGEFDGLVVRSATKVTKNVLESAKNLKIIGRAGVGIDNIDVTEATRKGVIVMNTPGGNTVSTAQLAMSLLCSVARKIPAADASMKAGEWARKEMMGAELHGKTLSIVGCGRIGLNVAKMAQAMGMKILGYDPVMPSRVAKDLGITLVGLDDIWERSDFITVHTPLTPDTRNLINDDTLAKCKTGVRLINCARGGIIDEEALLRALESGKVAGAALDVYTTEPPEESKRPLLMHPNLVCTPHLGASTEEAQVNVARDIAQQMCDTLEGKDYVGVANVGFLRMAQDPKAKPFIELGEIIGAFHAQISHPSSPLNSANPYSDDIVAVDLSSWGGTAVKISTPEFQKLLEASVLRGLLKHTLQRSGAGAGANAAAVAPPTLISAKFMAESTGITSTITSRMSPPRSTPYRNLVSCQVTTASGHTSTIVGSVFYDRIPHIVQIDDCYSFPAFRPAPSVLLLRNEDRPGAISGVLEVLVRHNLNVGKLSLGPPVGPSAGGSASGLALCLIEVDGPIPESVMEELRAMKSLESVHAAMLEE